MCVHDDNNGLIVRNGYGGAGESATDDKFARPRPLRVYNTNRVLYPYYMARLANFLRFRFAIYR